VYHDQDKLQTALNKNRADKHQNTSRCIKISTVKSS
ncbi:hypothetical protein AAULH_13786, partial [Lactobacillus helveticus MTCC 5463]